MPTNDRYEGFRLMLRQTPDREYLHHFNSYVAWCDSQHIDPYAATASDLERHLAGMKAGRPSSGAGSIGAKCSHTFMNDRRRVVQGFNAWRGSQRLKAGRAA